MYQPVTFQTALLLAEGVSPATLARLDAVKPNTIHQRRLRFDRYVGGRTPRVGKLGRPKKVDPAQQMFSFCNN